MQEAKNSFGGTGRVLFGVPGIVPRMTVLMPASTCVQVAMSSYSHGGGSAQAMAEALLSHAQARRTKDDVCVIVVVIRSHLALTSNGAARMHSGSAESSGASADVAGMKYLSASSGELTGPGADASGSSLGAIALPELLPIRIAAQGCLKPKARHSRTASTGGVDQREAIA